MSNINFGNIKLYDWVPFFHDLASKISEIGKHPDKSEVLKEKSIDCFGTEAAINLYKHVDPFSFFYFLAQKNTTNYRAETFERVKAIFDLAAPLPTDYIFPTPTPNTAVLYHDGIQYEIELLWSLFMEAIESSNVSNGKFISTLGIHGVGVAKLTQTLFLINPKSFLPIDDRTISLPVFSDTNLKSLREEIEKGGQPFYQARLNQIKDSFPGCEFYEVNLFAYLLSTHNLKLNNSFYQVSSNVYGGGDDYIDDFFEENGIWMGGPASSDNSGAYTYPVTEPRQGDVMIIRTGNLLVRAIGIVLENEYAATDGWTEEGKIKILKIAAVDRNILSNQFTRKEALNRMTLEKVSEVRNVFPESFDIIDTLTGISKVVMPGKSNLSLDFEKLCRSLFQQRGLEVIDNTKHDGDFVYDFSVHHNTKKVCVEVKLYRSGNVPPETLRRACALLNSILNTESASLLLISSSEINNAFKDELFKKYKVHVWDIRTLFNLSIDVADTFYSLSTIFVKATNQQVDELSKPDGTKPDDYVKSLFETPPPPINIPKTKVEKKGSNLCAELKGIARGREEDYDNRVSQIARQYEVKCTEILRYLFEDHLEIWNPQNHTDENLHIFDLICRIASTHDFWIDLSKDFRTRYVVFEFKNYQNKIKQGQIYTTEKYLYTTALRSVGFIISRLGPDDNAEKAAKGALRETGKLIVNLTDSDLCKMLTMKDNSNDYTEVLINKVDEILTKIIR